MYLVGCCIQSSIGGRLRPRRILIFIFVTPSFDGRNDLTASSPIVIALRSLPPNHILTFRPTFGWLLRPPIQQKPSKSKAPSLSHFFFRHSNRRPKRRVNVFPTRSSPAASPIKLPPCRRHHRSVHCCVDPTSGGHPRPVLRPSLNFFMGAITVPQTRGPNVVRAGTGAGRLHQAHGEPRRNDLDPWRM